MLFCLFTENKYLMLVITMQPYRLVALLAGRPTCHIVTSRRMSRLTGTPPSLSARQWTQTSSASRTLRKISLSAASR